MLHTSTRYFLALLLGSCLSSSVGAEPDKLVLDLGKSVSMGLIYIPAGSFEMGSSTTELLDQKPAHRVTISTSYYMGEFEVTQEQWAAVVDTAPSVHKGPTFPGHEKYPVENVSWNYCQQFIAALGAKFPEYKFRLPTEAEWEYACRAGTNTEFSFGDDASECAAYAWFSGNAGSRVQPVGQKKPNAWGLHDMHGNVWEWCDDRYKAYPGGVLPGVTYPGESRVLRGGAFNSLTPRLTCAYRHYLEPVDCGRYYGFRCVAIRKVAP